MGRCLKTERMGRRLLHLLLRLEADTRPAHRHRLSVRRPLRVGGYRVVRGVVSENENERVNPLKICQMKATSKELICTNQSWDGAELPDYLQGRLELVAKITPLD